MAEIDAKVMNAILFDAYIKVKKEVEECRSQIAILSQAVNQSKKNTSTVAGGAETDMSSLNKKESQESPEECALPEYKEASAPKKKQAKSSAKSIKGSS